MYSETFNTYLQSVVPNRYISQENENSKCHSYSKSGDRYLFSKYRLISLPPSSPKIEKHSLLNTHHYGFRANWSTTIAVMKLVEEISTAMENKEYTVGVFIELKLSI